ncbi:glycosyltransferase family 4 protein [Marmoricola sp. Leaf446]|uniref:glycosyltransferase family 4 protein n=1 Tax=Marmoricola sp. Leaf446 TaxID=1736379 RepID=UPI00138F0636|nr:glycosyltransferase family 4 protein [Marmoricola sp. Leaf446]
MVLEQCAALDSYGHDVRLFRRDTDELRHNTGYQVRAAATTITGRGARPNLNTNGWEPDIVHLHNTFPNWSTNWIEDWQDRLVVTLHNYRTLCAAATLFRNGHECDECLTKSTLAAVKHSCYRGSRSQTIPLAFATRPGGSLNRIPRTARRVVALNEHAQSVFAQEFGRDVDLIPNFVRAAQRRQDPQPAWAYVGRLDEAKGILNLIQQWPRESQLHVFGTGPQLKAAADASARSRGSVVLRGMTSHEELLRLLPSYTGMIVPSLWKEGLPTAILEGLAAGLPLVVASPVAAAESLARAGASVTYNPYDEKSLHKALLKVATSGAMMSRSAIELHALEYSDSAWLSKINSMYESVAEGPT